MTKLWKLMLIDKYTSFSYKSGAGTGQLLIMDTIEIDKKISAPGFLGAFAYDTLPPRKDGDFSLVINTEVESEQGSHWIALVKKGNLMYFLDSYGRNVKHFTFPVGFKETILKYVGDSKLKFNPSMLQQLMSNFG